MEATLHTPDNSRSNSALVKRLLTLTWHYRTGCVKVLALQISLLALGLCGLALTGLGIDYIRHEIQPDTKMPLWPFHLIPPPSWTPMGVVAAICAAILLLAALRALTSFFYSLQLANLLQGDIVVDLRSKIYSKLQRLSFRFFDENATGSIINRVTGDVQSTRLFIDGVIIQAVIMALSLGVYLVYMLNIHVMLTLVCLCTTPLLLIMSSYFSRLVRPAYQQNRTLVDKMILVLSESVEGIHVIKGFAREPETITRFSDANRKVFEQKLWIVDRVSRFTPAIGFLTQVNLVILLIFGGLLVIRGTLPLGAGLIVFAGLLQQFSSQVSSIVNIANSVQESLTSARRVFEVLDEPIEITSPPDAIAIPRARGAVRFENVSFDYSPTSPVLRDISFEAKPGQCIAIVGATGSGKSTLLSLLPRFYDPDRGSVMIDGINARSFDLDDLRRNVGIVFQENFLFSNTVAANIAFGTPQASQAQIEQAARIAAAHDFIMELKQGYDTVLGERGSDLSGGQRQRIAIARALLLEPAILILDDPTAAIDSQTEFEIMASMENAMRGRTTFVVAHRLSTLQKADVILVLDHGRIVQMGHHTELMAVRGPYQRLAHAQISEDESLHPSADLTVPEGRVS